MLSLCSDKDPIVGCPQNLFVGTPNLVAMLPEDAQFVTLDFRLSKEVARIGVFRDQPQRFLLAAPTNEYGDARLRERRGRKQWFGQMIVAPLVGIAFTGKHMMRDLQGFLQALKAFLEWWIGDAQPDMLAFEPGCAQTKKRSPSRKHIEGRDRLDEHARIAISNACHHRSQAHALGCASQVRKGAVPLEHLHLGWS